MPLTYTNKFAQFRFGSTGLLLNDDSYTGLPFVDIDQIDGLDSPEFRSTSRDREGLDGGFVDVAFEKARTIVLGGTIYAPSPTAANAYLDQLKANFAPNNTAVPLYFNMDGSNERVVFCKSLGIRYSIDRQIAMGTIPFQVTFIAEDPTLYDSMLYSPAVGIGSLVATGRGYNKAFNYGYGSLYTGSSITIQNNGNKPADATIRIWGDCINPKIIFDTVGKSITVAITLGVTDYLDINLRNRTIILNGTASRRSLMSNDSRWSLLPVGVSYIRFSPLSGTAGAMTVNYRAAYR